jgi:hypothetical protein
MINEKKVKLFFILICVLQLFYIFHYRSGFNAELLGRSFNNKAGEEQSLPPETLEIQRILIDLKLNSFNLSDNIKSDTYLYQRTIEFNYPFRLNVNLNTIFFLKSEILPEKCQIIKTSKFIKLVEC